MVTLSTLGGLLVAEALLAVRLPVPTAEYLFHLRTPFEERVFRPDPGIMPGISGPSRSRVSSLGVRGDEPGLAPGEYRVLCVGGSTTECVYLDDSETWPSLVQAIARRTAPQVWVGNAGFSGYTTAEHLEFLENSPLVPRMHCVVLMSGVNDLARFLGGGSFEGRFFHARMRIRPALLGSNLANLLSATRQRLAARGERAQIRVEDELGRSYVERRRERREAVVAPLPDLAGALRGFEERLERIADTCGRRGVRLVLVTQPVLWDGALTPDERELLWMGSTGQGYVAPGELREAMRRYDEVTATVAERRGIEWIDARDLDGVSAFFYDDCHFNEAGAAEVAGRVAARILERVPEGGSRRPD